MIAYTSTMRIGEGMKTRSAIFLAAAVWLLASAAAAAEDASRFSGAAWAPIDEPSTMAAAAAITPAAYPNCDEATIDERIEYAYEADGTGESQDESFTKVLTEKGKRDSRTIVESFMLPYSRIEVARLEVIGPGGEILPIDVAANSEETIDDRQMDENIYDPNDRLLKVSVPNLEIGDVVHCVVRQTIDRPIMPGQSADENLFEGEAYIRHLVYEVRAPKGRPILRKALRAEIPGKVAYSEKNAPGGGSVMRWEVSDVPRIFEEPDQPPDLEVLQRLFVSTTSSWKDVSKWYWELGLSHLEADSPELRAETATLTAGLASEDAKVQALFYYVSKNIRYMGLTPEKDRPGFEPHDVGVTFEKKYGVCRDKAALLVRMLRLAGVEAYPVLISVGAKKDPDVPTPFFDHAVVAVARKTGGYELMDPTDEHTRQLLPYYDDDRSYLVCRPEGENLRLSPVRSPAENMMRVRTAATLSVAGTLRAKSVLDFDGANDDIYRNAFARMKGDELRRFFEARLKRSQPGARLETLRLTPADMLDMSSTLHAELEYTVEGLTASGAGVSIATIPWIGKSFGLVNYLIGSAGLETRKYPMRTSVACGVDESLSIVLDGGFAGKLSLPAASVEDDDMLGYRQEFALKDRTLDCRRGFSLKGVDLSPAQYLRLKRSLRTMDYDSRKAPLLGLASGAQPAPAQSPDAAPAPKPSSDARILDVAKTLNVIDGSRAVYHVEYSKLILSYEGKVREAEVKVAYNPACESVKFLKGIVVSKDGSRQEVSPSELNVMDADWDASAKRYTGAKILVANLPGIDIGSTIEVAYEIELHDKPFLSGFEQFMLSDGIDHKTFELSAPAASQVATSIEGSAGAVTEQSPSAGDRKVYRWRSDNVDPLPTESALPPPWIFASGVRYYVGDFKAELAALNGTMVRRATGQERAAEKARAITAACKSPLESVGAIRDFVAKTIRLAGPYFADLPLSELSDADTTLADCYGHEADRAILLYSMLAAAGLSPEFVLASALPSIPRIRQALQDIPSPREFGLPLVRVAVDGREYYLNDTDQYARLGSTGSDSRLGLSLPTGTIEELRALEDCRTSKSTTCSLSVSEEGKAQLTVATSYYGGLYDAEKRYFSELSPEERQRYFQGVVAGVAQGARPVGGLSTDFEGYPGVEKYTVSVDDFAVADGDYLYFNLPYSPSFFRLDSDRRALPYFIPGRTLDEVRISIAFPSGYGTLVIAPDGKSAEVPDGGGRISIGEQSGPGSFEMAFELEADPAIVPQNDYAGLLKLETALERRAAWTFLLKRSK
jgi:transglutaminase-like putative cysteine protease